MNFFRNLAIWLVTLSLAFLQFSVIAFAAGATTPPEDTSKSGTVLPSTKKGVPACKELMNEVAKNSCLAIRAIFKKTPTSDSSTGDLPSSDACYNGVTPNFGNPKAKDTDVLACGIKTGSIHLWMIPYYIKYILTFIIGLSGLVAVGGIVYGGYLYLFAGVSSEKDQGKKAIQYGVIGMVMTLVAWAFVSIIISLFTG